MTTSSPAWLTLLRTYKKPTLPFVIEALRHRARTLDPMGDGFDLTASLVGKMLASRLPEQDAVIYDEKCGELRVPDAPVARAAI
jgi:hypothetical protein